MNYQVVQENEIDLFSSQRSYHFYICTFYLKGEQWRDLCDFFSNKDNIHKCLTHEDLNKTKKNNFDEDGSTAVVLVDADSTSYTFLNSWGKYWGDNGRFTIKRDAIKSLRFYSIGWSLSDLTNNEKSCYENRKKKAVEKFYQIIDYANFVSPIDKKKNDNYQTEDKILKIFTNFCEDYWKPGES